ncbi:protein muscleblind isoform X13 [Anoplolepis gracilipes]|uniref:protein muscleblind isoform X13 n=1 Tax=Anoplolepis gracilipes TaxID=354296 RepID=UPI003BA1DD7C
MAMVNMNNLLNGKDSRWLQLEVCREFQRNKCTRPDTECKFAHPPANVEVQNGRVTACYDSIKITTKLFKMIRVRAHCNYIYIKNKRDRRKREKGRESEYYGLLKL